MRSIKKVKGGRLALLSVMLGPLVVSCGGGPTAPTAEALTIRFEDLVLALGSTRSGEIRLTNPGSVAVGPIELRPGLVRDAAGAGVAAAAVRLTPETIPTLNPGASASVQVVVDISGSLQVGSYRAAVEARHEGNVARIDVDFSIAASGTTGDAASVAISGGADQVRRGDVIGYVAEVQDASGDPISGVAVLWSVSPPQAGLITSNGTFVAYAAGPVEVSATVGAHAATRSLDVTDRSLTGDFTLVGRGAVSDRYTSDLWIHGAAAYTGTWGIRGGGVGNQLRAWDISDPASPRLASTTTVNARTVNDVKVRADGQLGLITHEGSSDAINGVTLLDLSDPLQPLPITRFTDGLEGGIHNAWIDGNYAYLVLDGNGSGLHILDVSDPSRPRTVASHYEGSSFLHDVYVRDGLAFLSQWDDGLVILDVGNGVAGGSPTRPVEVSRIDLGGNTHNAWYWPEGGYVFVGEESFFPPGIMRVVDVRELAEPKLVATFAVSGQTPHNFWLDEDRAILYLAWYGNGLRALDVSGALMGELDRQGREIAGVRYAGVTTGCPGTAGTCAWAPQLHQGLVWISDMHGGLFALRPTF